MPEHRYQDNRADRHIASHPHTKGKIAAGHISGQVPLGVRQPVVFRFIEPSAGLDLHCQDCASTVTALLGGPPCVAGTFAVRHSDGCSAFAAMEGGAR
jgi:hypothetical protein